MENMNIIQTGSISCVQARVKGHRSIRRVTLMMPDKDLHRCFSNALRCSLHLLLRLLNGHDYSDAEDTHAHKHQLHSKTWLHRAFNEDAQLITSAVEENALLCPGIEPKWVRSACPNSTERTKHIRLYSKHLLHYTGTLSYISDIYRNITSIEMPFFFWLYSHGLINVRNGHL